ncbi:osteoclast-stimulating factor 1-like [Corticium candelabrum]|uniref:osteoclast-stimulating factor 1-like n=1 Tax=Corticium candelabrum TaxID=121492 RepID=UPI002E26E88C|nr:osteoclast-stimulating factor 1-like [Corticium candelabrum]
MSGKPAPAPPKPRPKPGHVDVVRALFNYTAQHVDELSFEEGDTLYIVDKNSEKGWWKGRCGDKIGLIPTNYIESSTETIDFPLHEAAKRGNVGFLRECLANKVSVNGLDKSGSTALHWVANGGHVECAQILLKTPNIEINAQNKLGDTPLHNAAWKNHPEIVQMLLARAARTDLLNKEKKSAYDMARDPEVGKLLQVRMVLRDDEYGGDEDSD